MLLAGDRDCALMGDFDLTDLPQPDNETTLPPAELETDGDNPNSMNSETFALLVENIRERGWLGGPIVTNTDGLIADGEHRWRAAQEAGLDEVPVRQYDIDDSTRRLWRQELNKIRGAHDEAHDALEYDKLLESGYVQEITALTEAQGEDIDAILDDLWSDDSDFGADLADDGDETGDLGADLSAPDPNADGADESGGFGSGPGTGGPTGPADTNSPAAQSTNPAANGNGASANGQGAGQNDPYEAWDEHGPVSYENEDKTPAYSFTVYCETEEDFEWFKDAIGQDLGPNPRYVHIPSTDDVTFVDEEYVADEA